MQPIAELLKEGAAAVGRPLADARLLPSRFYTSTEIFEAEKERIFRRNWVSVGHVAEIPKPGDRFRIDVAGEPLLIVRGRDGVVRALSAVCRHRAMLLAEGAGNAGTISCPYHKWTYALDGALMAAPLMEGASPLDEAACALPSFACEVWNGFIFVNLDGRAAPLAAALAPLGEELAPWKMDELEIVGRVVFDQRYNWKVLADNFMEAYHHFAIHPETFEPNYPAAMSQADEARGPFAALRMPHKGNELSEPLFPPLPDIPDEARRGFSVFNIYPSMLLAVFVDTVTWYRMEIESAGSFRLTIYLFAHPRSLDVPDAEALKEFLREAATAVHIEDIAACEGVQKGLESRMAVPGRLSPLEAAIHQHQQWLMGELVKA
ncbi:Rieske (2Fe-2S) domain protein [Parvibaculum lavamentivorans DS-1]|uniref:Rieske (2Fe-2S) domain protein n=1 Tax=Parvibaculum lavamentivorans (strain DS-1 / DSM 13023 / NCIMB 13966) TaxID=402881 RepID=A7HUI4_PARL1|nr:SRPBCC family protein [Parvibaculum lavamentivorans]ABS63567.1 Rieske (2Fe-2S) domain protein [Parvibaculum lavamentivorans DS-1]